MSTRSAIIINDTQGHPLVAFYRHSDGYLAGAGKDLLDTITDWIADPGDLARAVQEKAGTDGFIAYDRLPSDLEYIYRVTPVFDYGMSGTVRTAQIKWCSASWNTVTHAKEWTMYETDSVASFEAKVNAARQEADRIIAKLKAEGKLPA